MKRLLGEAYNVLWLILAVLLLGCRSETASTPAGVPDDRLATAQPEATSPAVDVSAATLTPRAASPATPEEQYRVWMAEARTLHPYAEPLETMWAVMICESEGEAARVAEPYHGLFQYHPDTWAAAWNPYRDQPILDPRAQIFATAKAWQEGNQSWWGCYSSASQ